jgi:putative endonuclease
MTETLRARKAGSAVPRGVRTPKQRAGDAAEDKACAHLTAHGLRIVGRNVRYRVGELDIVALESGTLVFVEVRLRNDTRFGGAGASVDAFKRKRVARAAQLYLMAHYGDSARRWPRCRFDVMAVAAGKEIEWLRDAFAVED